MNAGEDGPAVTEIAGDQGEIDEARAALEGARVEVPKRGGKPDAGDLPRSRTVDRPGAPRGEIVVVGSHRRSLGAR
jgi:hypothetical protein